MSMNPLEAITERVISAAQTEDLEALGGALEQRARALDGLRDPVQLQAACEGGEIALAALRAMKRRLQAEHSRLGQMRTGFGQDFGQNPLRANAGIDLNG